MSEFGKTICLDFDGVIHSFRSPWTTAAEIPDPPVPAAFPAIRAYLEAGLRVVVQSARAASGGAQAMFDWFILHGGSDIARHERFSIRAEKPAASIYVDDRAWLFMGDNFPTLKDIENFKPWNK